MDHHPVIAHLSPLPARDPVAALAVAGGDADLAAELFAALLVGLPDELAALRAAMTAADWDGLAEHAHQVRGATRYCGVPALDEATESLERAARSGDPQRIALSFISLEEEAERVRRLGG
ncbi:Hpt domain-containing protein [uncultured Thiodictyon sp.]|uniref:Hpt domain-containing protein n=1 Tax=uncultured Thiodictyon sp. TaxID=1846217 RepID=UPI0025DD0667|nr:Hpt domain-containing protein [uncultured Thiodictyon sp.]